MLLRRLTTHNILLQRHSTMSTAPATLHNFAVWAPDGPDEGAFERRLAVLAPHRENVKALLKKGTLVYAGPLLSPESITSTSTEKKMVGSLMIYAAESLEEAKKLVESDLFYTTGVWDKEKLAVLPWQEVSNPANL